jgi:4-amino-4-deoxy-L-arabinose transferase-like glycosyltransferase
MLDVSPHHHCFVTDSLSPKISEAPRVTPAVWAMAVTLFLFTLILHSRHNDFPYTYHPDEGGKVIQVLHGERNFHHPLLMLQTTAYAMRLSFLPHDPQATVQTGRWVSAAFSAGSVVAFALLAWWNYGLLVGWGAGLAVALQEDVFELSHYMKEDPALLFGLALALFAAHVWWRRPQVRSLEFLAIACGLAVSGKYIGIVALVFALPIVIWHRAADSIVPRTARLKTFAIVFAVTFLVCNFPLFGWKVSSPFRSIGHEMTGVTEGHQGLSRHAAYFGSLKNRVPPVQTALIAIYAVALLATARRRTPPEWITLLFPIAFLLMISSSPKVAERYLLPVSAMVPLLAALGAGEIGRLVGSPHSSARTGAGLVASAILLGWATYAEYPAFHRTWGGFEHDDPTAVAEWVKAHLPADAKIAEDHRVNLSATKADDGPSSTARVPQTVLEAKSGVAADLGTVDELRAKGVGYVAVCRQNYGRYFNDENKPQAEIKTGYDKRREFYARVFQDGKLLKEWPKGAISYLQPGIRLYQIAPERSQPEPQ